MHDASLQKSATLLRQASINGGLSERKANVGEGKESTGGSGRNLDVSDGKERSFAFSFLNGRAAGSKGIGGERGQRGTDGARKYNGTWDNEAAR